MKHIIDNIFSGNLTEARKDLEERIQELVIEKLNQIKLRVAAEMSEQYDLEVEPIEEGNIQRMGRTKLVRVRIRAGKVQRRKKLSAVKGYTIRGGKMIRMSAQERRHRKMAARRAKFKRRAKMQQSLRKRKRSLMRRRALGL